MHTGSSEDTYPAPWRQRWSLRVHQREVSLDDLSSAKVLDDARDYDMMSPPLFDYVLPIEERTFDDHDKDEKYTAEDGHSEHHTVRLIEYRGMIAVMTE